VRTFRGPRATRQPSQDNRPRKNVWTPHKAQSTRHEQAESRGHFRDRHSNLTPRIVETQSKTPQFLGSTSCPSHRVIRTPCLLCSLPLQYKNAVQQAHQRGFLPSNNSMANSASLRKPPRSSREYNGRNLDTTHVQSPRQRPHRLVCHTTLSQVPYRHHQGVNTTTARGHPLVPLARWRTRSMGRRYSIQCKPPTTPIGGELPLRRTTLDRMPCLPPFLRHRPRRVRAMQAQRRTATAPLTPHRPTKHC